MEDAAKALLMAAGVLFGIMVLSIGVYLYGSFFAPTNAYVTKLDTAELRKYNAPFEVLEDREDITPQEVVSVIEESNQRDLRVQIVVDGTNVENYSVEKINEFLTINVGDRNKIVHFKCVEIIYNTDKESSDSGKVVGVKLSKIEI